MASFILFYRLVVRPLAREVLRTTLTVLSVALGVAVVLAIELAGQAAVGSFRASMEALAGDTELEVVSVGGVPEGVVGRLATLPYPIRVQPRIEEQARLAGGLRSVTLLGLDLVSQSDGLAAIPAEDADDRSRLFDLPSLLAKEGGEAAAWVSEGLGPGAGGRLRLLAGSRTHALVVKGTIPAAEGVEDLVVVDIAEAQRILERAGRVDRVLVDLPEGAVSTVEWAARLQAALPAGAEVRERGTATAENRKMLAAFRSNLRVLSYVALVVGAFLIYNTISVSVVRRRPEIGLARAIGASRAKVLLAFLAEAAFFGLVGGFAGLPLGRTMASGAVNLMAATVESLYVSSRPGAIETTPWAVGLALGMGLAMAVVSALSPALEASRVSPVVAMARGERETAAAVHRGRDLGVAIALAGGAWAAAQAPPVRGIPLFGYLAALLLVGASAFSIPALVHAVAGSSGALLRRTFGVEALLASRSLAGSLRRTSVLVGALATATAMMVAVAIMVGSFRQTVLSWLDAQLPADIYLSPGGGSGPDRHPAMPSGLAEKIEALPDVAAVDRFRAYGISFNGLPATLASTDTRVAMAYRRPEFLSGRASTEVLRGLAGADTAIVSEPFASKHGVSAGDVLTLSLGGARVRLRVLDVYFDYASERGYVMVDRETMLRYLPDQAPSGIAVYLSPDAGLAEARAAIEKAASGYRIGIATNRQLRAQAVAVFDRTFAITWALEAVAILVAVVGIVGAMIALVIDRRRELGLLRFLGAARAQVRKLILMEAGLLGLLANAAGTLLGVALSIVLIFVINKQSFGWTIQLHWPVGVLAAGLALVYAATLLAGLYPARIATGLNPIEVVRDE